MKITLQKILYELIDNNLKQAQNAETIDFDHKIKSQDTFSTIFLVAEASTEDMSSLLFRAIRLNKPISLQGILDSGINPNCYDSNGDTPLNWAVRKNSSEMVKILLEFGADPLLKNKIGYNAINYALKKPDIITLFEKEYSILDGDICLLMYEQAVQSNNDVLAKKILKLAVMLDNTKAIEITEKFNHSDRTDLSALSVFAATPQKDSPARMAKSYK